MKNLPIGVEDYLNAQQLCYVDKTLFIKDIIDFGLYKSMLFTRPRRFGKSLNLSMLEYFFSNSGDFGYAFKDKKIFKEDKKYREYLNNYPVIRLNLKDIYSPSFDGMTTLIKQTISEQYIKFNFLENSDKLTDYEKSEYKKIASMNADDIEYYITSVKKLSLYLYKQFNKKVIILIDEYDSPIEQAYECGYYDQALMFFKRFYSNTLKGNENVLFSVITGVLEISKESLYSGLNNPVVISVYSKDFSQYFGFTTEEVTELLEKFNIKEDINNLRKYYGGYGSSEIEIFNPWSILNYINEEVYRNYWVNTGTTSILGNIISNIGLNGDELFTEFINANTPLELDPTINFQDLNNVKSIYSYLVQLGYLVARTEDFNSYRIFIPNEEIRGIFQKEVIGRNVNKELVPVTLSLKEALKNGDVNKITEILNKYILDSYSYYDLKQEKDYQNIITGILSVVFDDYVTKSEVNSKLGRCDIMISPKKENDIGIIIEIKKYNNSLSNKRLKNYALKAIEQIKTNRYYNELFIRKCNKILLYGFVFDDKKFSAENEIIKN